MPNFANYLADDRPTSIGDLIAIKATAITVYRSGVSGALDPQTVRLETLSSQRAVQTDGGITHMIDAMALGYKNHPTIADTDLQVGDRFVADGVAYEVVIVMPAHVDNVQAYVKVRA